MFKLHIHAFKRCLHYTQTTFSHWSVNTGIKLNATTTNKLTDKQALDEQMRQRVPTFLNCTEHQSEDGKKHYLPGNNHG